MLTHTDDFRVAGDRKQDVDYVYKAFNDRFSIKEVTNGIMLGVIKEWLSECTLRRS